ncbi:MAG TPA: hypothetical protein VND93_33180 [Myxococcales bacterium]|jgi:hypothetical protein|nr:hypothetical protein [Myxococcales bacterium]
MGRFVVFVLAGVLGAASAWASRSVRTSEEDLLPLLAPGARAADPMDPVPLTAAPKAAPKAPAAAPALAPPPAPAAAPAPAARPPEASWTVAQAQGVLRLTPDGEWVDVSPGAALAVGDQLRTKSDGKLVLASASRGQVSVGPLGRVALRSTPDGSARLRCSDGVLNASPQGGALAIELRAGDALAEASSPYTALCGAERAYVFAAGGQVAVTRGPTRAQLEKGEVASVPASGDLARQKLPAAVDLQVDPPKQQEKVAVITGHVSPGTRVRVGDVPAEVDGSGRFSARHSLQVGENKLSVLATDLAGREKTVALAAITVAAPAPRPVFAAPKPSGGGGGAKSKGGFTWGGKK